MEINKPQETEAHKSVDKRSILRFLLSLQNFFTVDIFAASIKIFHFFTPNG